MNYDEISSIIGETRLISILSISKMCFISDGYVPSNIVVLRTEILRYNEESNGEFQRGIEIEIEIKIEIEIETRSYNSALRSGEISGLAWRKKERTLSGIERDSSDAI